MIYSLVWLWNLGWFLWNFEAEFPKPSLNRDTRAWPLKHELFRIHLKKRLCASLMSEIEFKIIMSLLLNQNPTFYAKVQVVDTSSYAQSYKRLTLFLKLFFKFMWRIFGTYQYSNLEMNLKKIIKSYIVKKKISVFMC